MHFAIIIMFAFPAILTISARNFGEWAELKQVLKNYQILVEKYEAENGSIVTYEKELELYKKYPPPTFRFSDSEEIIYVRYLEWISSDNKMGIAWGKGANAAFELSTMFCVYSD